mmetsp:Transcript_16481/g.25741  ORF Transcript_16481/g.25741 Transcript_16481/m.25741 type:complete len:402 (-) Transcript_16481:239-1444(-)
MTMQLKLAAAIATFTTRSAAALSTVASPAVASPIVKNAAVPGLKNGMDYVKIGESDLIASKVCMGTMTFGEQNTLEEGVDQLNLAFDEYGINFLDTAEMYPVPTKADTQGATDRTVAAFLKGRKREDVILATKVCGRSDRINWLRKDKSAAAVTREQILESVDSSLERLETDYIDLLQIHWPDRYVPIFGMADFSPSLVREATSFEEQLSALKEVVDSGKVRYIGVSNETPYGVCTMVEMAKRDPDLYARIVSIQNSYSLVCRKDYEAGLAEACYYHNVASLPYSPLSGGVLTGKYANPDNLPEKARLKMFPGFMERYLGSQNEAAVAEYGEIAKEVGITPCELALSWCYHREHVASTIIGSTTIPQLKECIGAYDIKLDEETLGKIDKVYKKYTDPTKAY